jgi:hypothetical protein
MYDTLERYSGVLARHGVEDDPDHDGRFFDDFSANDWYYPSGRRVTNWIVAYILRMKHTMGYRRR